MKKRTIIETNEVQDFKPFSFFNSCCPTIAMAAELMNVSVSVVEEWLSYEHFSLNEEGHLTEEAIDFLADKYVNRLHKYFDNCIASWENLDGNERKLFMQFKSRYGKFYRFHIERWKDIDARRIAKDFKNELENRAHDAYFRSLLGTDYYDQFMVIQEVSEQLNRYDYCLTYSERSLLLFELSHSLYYGSRLKTNVPERPEYRDILLEILQENRFHIFPVESDSNVLIDAFLFPIVKQPQLAIAGVFGYCRHKNIFFYESFNKNQTYNCS